MPFAAAQAGASANIVIEVLSHDTGAAIDTALNTENISIVAHIDPPAADVGKQADIFIVDSLENGLVMKTADGQFISWSGDSGELEPAMANVTLGEEMELEVYSGAIDHVGYHNLVVGYQLIDGGPVIVYNSMPVTLEVVPDAPGDAEVLATGEAVALATSSSLPTMTLSRYSVASGTSVTLWWGKGVPPCTASASPAVAGFTGNVKGAGTLVLKATNTTVLTVSCANGTKSRKLAVTGGNPVPEPEPEPEPEPDPVPNPDPTAPAPTMTLSKYFYDSGASATMWWGKGIPPCTASSSPAYAAFTGSVRGAGTLVVSPTVTTVFTLSCSNGAKSRTLTVNGTNPNPNPNPDPDPNPNPLPVPFARTLAPISSGALDTAVINFSHTANREWNYDGHNVTAPFSTGSGYWDYSSSIATWLFDRATSWYKLYALSNDPAHRANAIRDTQEYAAKINTSGYFIPKVQQGENDTKYGYVTPFLWYERLTGDTRYRPVAERIYQASLRGYSTAYPITANLWTEREAGIHGEAALSWYEISKDQAALDEATLIIRQVGALAAANGGAPQVPVWRHEGGGASTLTNSPWMSALYYQFARRYYEITGDESVLQQVSAYFDWLDVNGLYDGSRFAASWAGVTVPYYLTSGWGIDQSDSMHCLDVAGIAAFAVDAKRKLGLPTSRAETRLDELEACAVKTFNYWTRTTTTLPKYRIQPPRAWNWWMRGRYELLP